MPDARFVHTLNLLGLERAGVKFGLNDLSMQEWGWLRELKDAIEQREIEKIKRH